MSLSFIKTISPSGEWAADILYKVQNVYSSQTTGALGAVLYVSCPLVSYNNANYYLPEGESTVGETPDTDAAWIPLGSGDTTLLTYKGTWNATTNTPTLANGVGTTGDFYRCVVGGSADFGAGAIVFTAGQIAAYNGTIWQNAGNIDGAISGTANDTVVSLAANASVDVVLTWSITFADTLYNPIATAYSANGIPLVVNTKATTKTTTQTTFTITNTSSTTATTIVIEAIALARA